MKVFRNLFSAGILAVVLMNFLFIGACKKKEDDDDQNNAILLWLATRPYVEQSKTGFFYYRSERDRRVRDIQMKRLLFIFALVAFLGLGLSFRTDRVPFFVREDSPKPFPVRLELLQPLKANADNWGFVRQSATWARGNSLFMDELIAGIRKNFPAGSTANITLANQNFNGQSYTLRLKLNSGNVLYQPSTLGSAVSYTNFFELRSSSDNQPALQLFFDDDPRSASGDGAVLVYQLSRLDPTQWAGATAIIESYVVQPVITGFSNQGLIQTYSWKGPLGADALGQDADTGRVIFRRDG